jgi:hypothetical protein
MWKKSLCGQNETEEKLFKYRVRFPFVFLV